MKKSGAGTIQSPYTNHMGKAAPTVDGVGGMTSFPGLGPAGVDGGVPLKIMDTSIAAPGTIPSGPSMTVVPTPEKS